MANSKPNEGMTQVIGLVSKYTYLNEFASKFVKKCLIYTENNKWQMFVKI